jgi:hypothetical protein
MERLIGLMATLSILSTVHPVLTARVVIRKTTLRDSWHWGVLALSFWTVTWLVTDVTNWARNGWADQLWLASAALMITPSIAVLGARRPGSRVWSAFVVLPLTIVLILPATTAWNRDFTPAPLQLETPMLAGYCLALLMGVANYVGTRLWASALLFGAACLSAMLSLSPLALRVPISSETVHAAATAALSLAVWLGAIQIRRIPQQPTVGANRVRAELARWNSVWDDFRDLFGIVWARRVLDRLNESSVAANWPVRLHLDGFAAADPANPIELSDSDLARIEHMLRRLLRRFVDPEWIDERLAR